MITPLGHGRFTFEVIQGVDKRVTNTPDRGTMRPRNCACILVDHEHRGAVWGPMRAPVGDQSVAAMVGKTPNMTFAIG